MLICPVCKKRLEIAEKRYICENGHSFDLARQGYANLSLKQKKNTGDNRLMVQARSAFLEKDYYDFMRQFVKQIIQKYEVVNLVDGGCGQGYYTREFSQVVKSSYGLDLSKEAIRHAAVHDKKSKYFVAGIYDMPFSDCSIDCVTSLFTPLAIEEVNRILKKEGIWIIVGPGPMHCFELKELMYEKPYKNLVPDHDFMGFECLSQDVIVNRSFVEDVWSLLEMTPYRYNSSKESLDKCKNCKGLNTTFEFVVSVWRKK